MDQKFQKTHWLHRSSGNNKIPKPRKRRTINTGGEIRCETIEYLSIRNQSGLWRKLCTTNYVHSKKHISLKNYLSVVRFLFAQTKWFFSPGGQTVTSISSWYRSISILIILVFFCLTEILYDFVNFIVKFIIFRVKQKEINCLTM